MAATNKMIEQFTTLPDLQAFAIAQQKTLMEITKEKSVLQEKVKHLEKLISSAVPVIGGGNKPIDFSSNDEEAIAREQLYILKQMSSERELTLEETKRVEIYSKILIALKDKPKTINVNSRQATEKELLAAAQENDNDRSNDQH